MVRVVVFDAYGTLFDVYAIGALAEQLYPGQGAAIAALWRDKQIEYTRLVSLSDPHSAGGSRHYQSFHELTRLALRYTLTRLSLDHGQDQEARLMAAYARLSAFPECREVLQQLKAWGLATAILSNGSPDMLASAVASADLGGLLDQTLSVDAVRQFKTMPAAYALVGQHFPGADGEVLFVSGNGWDVLGATWYGFQTLWVNRLGLPRETLEPPPLHEGRDLRAVLDVVVGG